MAGDEKTAQIDTTVTTYGVGGFDPDHPTENIVEYREQTIEVTTEVVEMQDVEGFTVRVPREVSREIVAEETLFLDVENHPDYNWADYPVDGEEQT